MQPARAKTVTRDDVARRAGVSPATVSRVYNDPEQVAASKQRAVRQAARALGYEPDRHASALRRSGSGIILLVMPPGVPDHASEARVYDLLYADAVRNVQEVINATTYMLRLATAAGSQSLAELLERSRPEGVICGNGTISELPDILRQGGLPYVCCTQGDHLTADRVCRVDEVAGGALAATSLLAAGRRRLAHITGHLADCRPCQDRWAGFHATCRAAGVGDPVLVDGGLGIHAGRQSARQLAAPIAAGEVDGVFVVNDLTAIGVVQSWLEAGLRIPQDVAVIGYDNLPFTRTLSVPLATLDINIGLLYRRAAEHLLHSLRHPQPVCEIIVPTLVPGASLPAPRPRPGAPRTP